MHGLISSVRESGEVYLMHSKCMDSYNIWQSPWNRIECPRGHVCYHIVYGRILSARESQNLGKSALTHIKCMGITTPMAGCLDAY